MAKTKNGWTWLSVYVIFITIACISAIFMLAWQQGINVSVRDKVVAALKCEPEKIEIPGNCNYDGYIKMNDIDPSEGNIEPADYNLVDYWMYQSDLCFDEFDKLSEQADEMQEKIDDFICKSEVNINNGYIPKPIDINRQSDYYTACQKLGLFCDLL